MFFILMNSFSRDLSKIEIFKKEKKIEVKKFNGKKIKNQIELSYSAVIST